MSLTLPAARPVHPLIPPRPIASAGHALQRLCWRLQSASGWECRTGLLSHIVFPSLAGGSNHGTAQLLFSGRAWKPEERAGLHL